MLPAWSVFIAISIRLLSGIGYLRSVLRGRSKPNPITWLIWSLTAFVAFFAQLNSGVGISAYMTLAIGLSPFFIFITALLKHPAAPHFTPFNIGCGIFALIGIFLWQTTNNPTTAIICSIFADATGGIPTVRKAYIAPHTEYAVPYALSVVSMVITLLSIQKWQFSSYAFPAYILCINSVIFGTIAVRAQATTVSSKYVYRRRN